MLVTKEKLEACTPAAGLPAKRVVIEASQLVWLAPSLNRLLRGQGLPVPEQLRSFCQIGRHGGGRVSERLTRGGG